MKALVLSLFDLEELNSPEILIGLSAIVGLILALIIGFFYKRYQSRK